MAAHAISGTSHYFHRGSENCCWFHHWRSSNLQDCPNHENQVTSCSRQVLNAKKKEGWIIEDWGILFPPLQVCLEVQAAPSFPSRASSTPALFQSSLSIAISPFTPYFSPGLLSFSAAIYGAAHGTHAANHLPLSFPAGRDRTHARRWVIHT